MCTSFDLIQLTKPSPSRRVMVGIDTAPHERPIYPNCSYMLADATEQWNLDDPSMKFDLVYIRSLFGVKDWPALYRQCFEYVTSDFTNKFR